MSVATVPAMPRFELEPYLAEKFREVSHSAPPLAPAGAQLLKRTRSVCPTCLDVVDADVAVVDGEVRMFKTCPAHGPAQGRVETDLPFYRARMNHAPVRRRPATTLVIPATHRCNLDCALCYVPKRSRDNLSFQDLQALIDAVEVPVIGLSGGEPTLRKDLPQLIRHVRARGKHCLLLSNAIKLSDPDFTHRLAEAGLQQVLLSFNGFNDATYQALNGRHLLDIKLQALANCVSAGLDVKLSPTIFPGLNEGDLPGLIELALAHAPHVSELRIRGACRVGKHGTFQPLTAYELFALVARALGRDPGSFADELDRSASFHSVIQFNVFGAFRTSGTRHELAAWNAGEFRHQGWDGADRDLYERTRAAVGGFLPPAVYQAKYRTLSINTWGWPDRHNIDFQEIWSHGIYHLHDNRTPMNFCEAVLRAEEL